MQQLIDFLITNTPLFYWTQSLWRDEAFSVWMARGSIKEIIEHTAGDFNPPLYYMLLKVWMLIFGTSEIVLRGFSLFTFLLFLIVVYKFAEKFFKNHEAAQTTTIFMALSPMLLYHAFEMRMYALLMLYTISSMYFFYTKRWTLHMIVTAIGLYTQPYMLFVLVAQNAYLLLQKDLKRVFIQTLGVFVLFLPWVPFLVTQLRNSGPMWMYPVTPQLVFAVLGNLFMGYEGTPGGLWMFMSVISLGFLLIAWKLWKDKIHRKNTILLYCWIFIPLILILSASLLKPLYVHRYLIYVSVGLVMLLSLYITSIKKPSHRRLSTLMMIAFLIGANVFAVSFHRKIPIRTTFEEITPIVKPADVIYAETPLVYYEALYYAPENTPVFLYNPNNVTPPRYVAGVGMPPSVWADTYPLYPARAFVIHEDGNYTLKSTVIY